MALSLPTSLTNKRDVLRIRREIEKASEAMLQRRIADTKAGVSREIPHISKKLAKILEVNSLSLNEEDLKSIDNMLEIVYESGPQIRLSFANEPDEETLEKMVAWFRREAHPATFIQVGIQPSLAGGCVLRTASHRYDFSLRTKLINSVDKLQGALSSVR